MQVEQEISKVFCSPTYELRLTLELNYQPKAGNIERGIYPKTVISSVESLQTSETQVASPIPS